MKRIFFLIISILLLVNVVFASTLEKGGQIDVNGKQLTVKAISQKAVVIDIDGDAGIVQLGETKIINGASITVNNIFYSDLEGSNVDLSAETIYTCGDGKCDETETPANCCKDCGCASGLECIENKCRGKAINKCNRDSDCDDNDPSTKDICSGSPRECKHIGGKICEKDEDCNDNNECTKDECKNFDCFNTKIENCSSNVTTEGISNKSDISINESNSTIKMEKETINETKSFIRRIIDFFKSLF